MKFIKPLAMIKLLFNAIVINLFLLVNIVLAEDTATSPEPLKKSEDLNFLVASAAFKPLIADPKWPRFTLAYQHYIKSSFGHNIFSPNFGAALPLVKKVSENGLIYELGLHAALFAVMDIGSNPTRLINADYFAGPTFTIKNQNFDSIIRISHTSSHLGDELLLSPQGQNIKRVNLSYETVEVILAYNFTNGLRPYVGTGYIIHADPKGYKSPELTLGMDYRSNIHIFNGYMKPVFGIYSKTSKNYGWHPNISIKGGFELVDKFIMGKSLQFLLEYYNGNSIHGQFYKKRESYVGTSINLEF